MANLWNIGEVSLWLEQNALKEYQQAFLDNEVDGPTLLQMTERMSERIIPKIRDQVKFLSALAQLKVESEAPVSQRAPTTQPLINCKVRFPPTLLTALSNKDAALKSHAKTRIKNMVIQALFDNLSQDTMYPSHIQYVQLLKSVLLTFPFLKESYGSGYDALHESLRNKFKKERKPLVNVDEIDKMREKYSASNTGRRRSSDVQSYVLVKKNKQTDAMDAGEDERSTSHHIATIKQECQKMRPNLDIIRQCLQKVQKYRKNYIQQHTTAEILKEFPCFSIPILLCEEASLVLKVDDVDKLVMRGFNKLSSQLVSMAPKSNLKSLCLQSVDESKTDAERNGQLVNAAILLVPSVLNENASLLFAINKEPLSPAPTIVLSSTDGKPLSHTTEVGVMMDGQKMIVDNEEADISLAMGVVLAIYQVYDIEYPCHLKKTFSFLEAFILKLDKRVPVAVQRVANALDIA